MLRSTLTSAPAIQSIVNILPKGWLTSVACKYPGSQGSIYVVPRIKEMWT